MAIELPNKRSRPASKQNKSRSSNSGVNKHKGETNAQRKSDAQKATRDNQMTLVLVDGRKRTFQRLRSTAS